MGAQCTMQIILPHGKGPHLYRRPPLKSWRKVRTIHRKPNMLAQQKSFASRGIDFCLTMAEVLGGGAIMEIPGSWKNSLSLGNSLSIQLPLDCIGGGMI